MISCSSFAQQKNNDVKIVGAMMNVMWRGQLYGNLNLDTIGTITKRGGKNVLAGNKEPLIVAGMIITIYIFIQLPFQ